MNDIDVINTLINAVRTQQINNTRRLEMIEKKIDVLHDTLIRIERKLDDSKD